MSDVFNSGPRLGELEGDPSRQAVDALRGYAYQLYASALAWLSLNGDGELYLEVAEDYAVVVNEAVKAVQVKDTAGSGSLTINSPGVTEAINAFVDACARNPSRAIAWRYLTTSPIGLERSTEDRISGKSTLDYWRKAAAGADVAPLRSQLSRLELSDATRSFILARDDGALRQDLLRKMHWDGGQGDLAALRDELDAGLVRYGQERLGIPAAECIRLSGVVLQKVLATATASGARKLTAAELFQLLDAKSRIALRRADVDRLFSALTSGGGSQTITATRRLIEPEADLPLPSALAIRQAACATARDLAAERGIAFIVGGTGMGKTLLARLTARSWSDWGIVELRSAGAGEVAERLALLRTEINDRHWNGVILDDLNAEETGAMRAALARLVVQLKRRDVLCLVTSYNRPSVRLLTELGVDGDVTLSVPYLDVEEVGDLVGVSGGDANIWRDAVLAASGFGHPQLVQAVIAGLRDRGWPADEKEFLKALDDVSDDAAGERRLARRLLEAAPERSRSLAYRLSLIIGRFERPLALAIGDVAPSIAEPGAQLDRLIGPWIDALSRDAMRVSPLLSDAGMAVLGATEQKLVHATIADHVTEGATLDVTKLNIAFLHGLRGEARVPLGRIAYAIMMLDQPLRSRLATWAIALRMHSTDAPIFPSDPALSVMLRLAQLLLNAGSDATDAAEQGWRAIQRELALIPDAEMREHQEYLVLTKVLLDQAFAGHAPDWIELILKLDRMSKDDPVRSELARSASAMVQNGRSFTLPSFLFLVQALSLKSVKALQGAFDALDALDAGTRSLLFASLVNHPEDFAMIANNAWLGDHRAGAIEALPAAEAYLRMAGQAQAWGYRDLAIRCHVCRSIMLDEYAEDPDAALNALAAAEEEYGADIVLSRAKAKIFYRHRQHREALDLITEIANADAMKDNVERAFLLREGAISAAETGAWINAADFFDKARQAASKALAPDMAAMSAGLRGDVAVALLESGEVKQAISTLGQALAEVSQIDAESSLKAAYIHRVLRHTALWVFGKVSGRRLEVDGEIIGMAPGACSNMEPSEEVKARPLGSLSIPWYLLAEADVLSGGASGVNAALSQVLGDRTVPALEYGLRAARLGMSIVSLDGEAFVAARPGYLAARTYLDRIGADVRNLNPINPDYGDLPEDPETIALQKPASHAALVLYCIIAALKKRADALASLKGLAIDIDDRTYIADSIEAAAPSPWQTAKLIRTVFDRDDLEPREVVIIGVQFLQEIGRTDLKDIVARVLAEWLEARWRFIIERQRFRLRNPNRAAPEVEHVLAERVDPMRFCAKISLVGASAVGETIPRGIQDTLVAWSTREP